MEKLLEKHTSFKTDNGFVIEIFKTKCRLHDGTIGEVCKKLDGDEFLVCNNNWYTCSSEWIESNFVL
jgi:hypothetical protein